MLVILENWGLRGPRLPVLRLDVAWAEVHIQRNTIFYQVSKSLSGSKNRPLMEFRLILSEFRTVIANSGFTRSLLD